MSQRPPSLLLGVGLSVIAMTVSLVLATSDQPALDSPDVAAWARSSDPSRPAPALKTMTTIEEPVVAGEPRFKETLQISSMMLSETAGVTFSHQWLRNDEAIDGATGASYRLRAQDVGQHISVAVTAHKSGFEPVTATASVAREIEHVQDVRTTVKYQVATRGRTTSNLGAFKTEVAEILADPRGWRSAGIAFEEVSSGAPMTIYLATAETLPSFASICSSQWSCRAGANVAINQTRWEDATDTWKAQNGTTLAGYRHMVVNHEVGHWLGYDHRYCTTPGKAAPLMMQQSKGLNGCTPNPWPLKSELDPPRFR